MFTPLEIEIIKKEVSFCKSEIIACIERILKNNKLNETEKKNMENLLETVLSNEYDSIEPNFSGKEILGYYINITEGNVKRAIGSGFCFGYDNDAHEVVLDSMCWVEKE